MFPSGVSVDYRCMLRVEPETILAEMETLLQDISPAGN